MRRGLVRDENITQKNTLLPSKRKKEKSQGVSGVLCVCAGASSLKQVPTRSTSQLNAPRNRYGAVEVQVFGNSTYLVSFNVFGNDLTRVLVYDAKMV